MHTLFPTDFGVLQFEGRDARVFLQAQLATDLRQCVPGSAVLAVMLAANGRVIAAGTLIMVSEETLFWLLDLALVDGVATHLRRYLLRSKLRIQPRPELHLCTIGSPNSLIEFVDAAGRSLALNTDPIQTCALDDQAFACRCIAAGVLDFAVSHSDRHLPQALGLHRFGGVALNKGCYPGQEIIARMHYLGKNKRVLARYTTTSAPSDPSIYDERGARVGELLNLIEENGQYRGLATIHAYATAARLAPDTPLPVVHLHEIDQS